MALSGTIFASGSLRPLSSAACSGNWGGQAFRVSIASAVRWPARSRQRRHFAGSDGWGLPVRPHRGASRLSAGSYSPPAGPYAVGNPGASDRQLRRTFLFIGDWRFFDRHEITFKKRPRMPRSSSARTSRSSARNGLVRNSTSIRENSFSSMKRGLPPIGAQRRTLPTRATATRRHSHGHYKTVTLVAGLRLSGLVAQKAFDKPMNAATFEEWVEKCLVPTLSKGDIVVMDNLSATRGQGSSNSSRRQEPSCDICRLQS